MARKDRMSGNEAVSFAIRQINPDVMPAFPITPSTEIPQMVSTYIANGEIDTEFVPVESEHSAMSAAIGSEAAGSKNFNSNIFCRTCIDVGGIIACSIKPYAYRISSRKPHIIRTDQHQL